MPTLNEVSAKAFSTAVEKGFHPKEIAEGKNDDIQYMAVRIALIHSEASEALAELREPNLKLALFAEELADIIIRTADLAAIAGIDLDYAVAAKQQYNETREHTHGGKTI